ncbi:ATP-dependent dethiobiotin synthetase BioD [Actinomadura chibensis]|uniref:ATP-dependent dethiobiotin synthetase BioD n=2 Tax=Actinomadura chibensis TaxID=392828 RepID=A0A5D0NRU1_9ACTN|nr:ATP-dependent dethiobiotin synthetase BioD [Actinomadura chibensis]
MPSGSPRFIPIQNRPPKTVGSGRRPARGPALVCRLVSVLVVTGTCTGVGKTVVSAALAAVAAARGVSVAVVKPGQTGVTPGEPGDLDEVRRLAGIDDLHELARFPDPLSPAAAARRAGTPPVRLADAADRVRALAAPEHAGPGPRLVLVEGAGGLLVRYDDEGATIADLARRLDAAVVVVTRPGLGTLNHTALTLEAMAHRGVQLAGVVIGAWPDDPDLAMRSNIRDLETIAARPLSGALPAGAGALDPAEFLVAAHRGLAPSFGGAFDAAAFRDGYGLDKE